MKELIKLCVASRHSHSRTECHAKSIYRCGGHSEFCQTFKVEVVKLVVAVIFAKHLTFNA